MVPLVFCLLSKPPFKCGGHTIRLGGSHNNQIASKYLVPTEAVCTIPEAGRLEIDRFLFGGCIKRCIHPVRQSSFGETFNRRKYSS